MGVKAFPGVPVQDQRRPAEKLRQLLRRQEPRRGERLQHVGGKPVKQTQAQQGLPLRLRQLLPEGGRQEVGPPLPPALGQPLPQVLQIQGHRRRPSPGFPVDGPDFLRRGRNPQLPRIVAHVAFRKQQVPAPDIADAVLQGGEHAAQTPEVLGDEHGAQTAPAIRQGPQHLGLPALQRELEIVEDQGQGLPGAHFRNDARRLLRVASVEVAQILQAPGGGLVHGPQLTDEPAEAVVRHALHGGEPAHRRLPFAEEPADRRGLPIARRSLQCGEGTGIHFLQLPRQRLGEKQILPRFQEVRHIALIHLPSHHTAPPNPWRRPG